MFCGQRVRSGRSTAAPVMLCPLKVKCHISLSAYNNLGAEGRCAELRRCEGELRQNKPGLDIICTAAPKIRFEKKRHNCFYPTGVRAKHIACIKSNMSESCLL